MEDTRRGLFSYEALRSRLCDSRFTIEGYKNLIGPVIRLRRLSDDELFALLSRITQLYAQYYGVQPRVTEEQQVVFLQACLSRAGADSMITPREMLRDYMTVLNVLMQNPQARFEDVVKTAPSVTAPVGANHDAPASMTTPVGANHDAPASMTTPVGADSISARNNQARKFTPDDLDF